MSHTVSEHDVNHLSREYKETWKEFLNFLIVKALKAGKKPDNSVTVKVDGQTVYENIKGRETRNSLQAQTIQTVKTTITNPESLKKGSISIYIGDEKVFQVKDGKVLKDDLELVSTPQQKQNPDIELHLDIEKMKGKGMGLAARAKEILSNLLQRKEIETTPEGIVSYQSGNYIFSCQNEQLSVISKEHGQEVLNSSGFTDKASEQDIKLLQKVEPAAASLKQLDSLHQQQLQPQISLKIKR